MGPKKSTAAARRARIEEMRRTEQARDRRNRVLTIAAVVAVLAGTVGGGWYLLGSVQEEEAVKAGPVRGEKSWSKLARKHVEKKVDYPADPPVGGNHNQVWLDCDAKVFTKPVAEENAVHSLEHGAVWVTYNDSASESDIQSLSDKVSQKPYTFLSPYKDQSSPVTLSAWGHQLRMKNASDPRVSDFLDKYAQGKQAPEPGASCSGGARP